MRCVAKKTVPVQVILIKFGAYIWHSSKQRTAICINWRVGRYRNCKGELSFFYLFTGPEINWNTWGNSGANTQAHIHSCRYPQSNDKIGGYVCEVMPVEDQFQAGGINKSNWEVFLKGDPRINRGLSNFLSQIELECEHYLVAVVISRQTGTPALCPAFILGTRPGY